MPAIPVKDKGPINRSKEYKDEGRNVARTNNQKASKKVKKGMVPAK